MYLCQYCSKTFTRQFNLKRRITQMHPAKSMDIFDDGNSKSMDIVDDGKSMDTSDVESDEDSDLKQHVLVPTHTAGHCLDWIISRNSQNYISNVKVRDLGISDHSALLFDMQSPVIEP